MLFLDSPFDAVRDQHSESYEAFLVPFDAELCGDWADIPSNAIAPLGRVPVERVSFDPTFRMWIDLDSLRLPLMRRLTITDEQWRDVARTFTAPFRTHSDAIWCGIRRCFLERKIALDSVVLAEAALPSETCRVLIGCASDLVFVLTYVFPKDAPQDGDAVRWSEISSSWRALPFADAIRAALDVRKTEQPGT
jgi:hypothetical protein